MQGGRRATPRIVGIGESRIGVVHDRTALGLYVDSILAAVADAGMALTDVDGLITMNSRTDYHLYHADYVAEYLGMRPRVAYTLPTGGSTTIGAVMQAASMVAAGHAETFVIAAADNIRTGFAGGGAAQSMAGDVGHPIYEAPQEPSVPAMYALLAQRHMHEYGTTREQLASVAVSMRRHAQRTEKAQFRVPITVADVLAAPPVADPFGRLDCAPISDGGGALVLSAAPASGCDGTRPVAILAAAEGHSHEYLSQADSLTTTAATTSGKAAYTAACLTPSDVDVAFLYDAFTILPILLVEDLGFCNKGEGGPYVADGHLDLEGSLPTNTHGGLLSYSHPGRSGSMLMIIEAIRQVRGTAGDRQVSDAEVVLVHAEGGVASSHGTLLMGPAR